MPPDAVLSRAARQARRIAWAARLLPVADVPPEEG
jgi:hypothetical protein